MTTRTYTRKTHCKQGHPYNAKNTMWRKGTNGLKVQTCRRCRALYENMRYKNQPDYREKKIVRDRQYRQRQRNQQHETDQDRNNIPSASRGDGAGRPEARPDRQRDLPPLRGGQSQEDHVAVREWLQGAGQPPEAV